jgi:hypothetical protein
MLSAELLEVSLEQDYLENSAHYNQVEGRYYEKLQKRTLVQYST